MFYELGKTRCPIFHKAPIVKTLIDNNPEHAQSEREVRARSWPDPEVCPVGHPGLSWINDDQLGSLIEDPFQLRRNYALFIGLKKVTSPHDDTGRWMIVV